MILCGDITRRLTDLPHGIADCIITDPPYGETSLGWDKLVRGWPEKVLPYLKPHGCVWVFGSMRSHMQLCDEFHSYRFAQDVVWEKHNGSSAANDRFRRVHEIVCQWYPSSKRWTEIYKMPPTVNDADSRTVLRKKNRTQHWGSIGESAYISEDGGPRIMRSVMYCPSTHGFAEHPTQKPTQIIEALIENSCPPGGTVFDPFCGSGSVGVAALAGARKFIGIELDEDYARIAERRLREVNPLFKEQVSA